ncbi:O-antigen ligase family protein [Pallidibacillus thermolactis]|uniref:O-antigen ligase family protein n=1 Tax=Pallidibacillus thermolactis TaxID=251051 RepID=UPI002E21A06C|nr:O-antigen ligase family protein [Pallidibacillus thermolactis subsp. kokeshiiformis]
MLSMFERYKFIDYLKIYIILQPILDILTSISIHYLNLSVTIGIAIRILFLGFSLFYIFFGNTHPLKKYIITYLLILFIVIGFGFILNFLTKPEFYIFSEVQFLVKVLYFPIIFIALFMCFSPNQNFEQVKEKLYSAVAIAMTLLSISLFIAILTDTSHDTYKWIKSGYTGWFFAGNELSGIVAICLPIALIYSTIKTKALKDFIYWIPTLLLAASALLIGTKVSFFAMIMTIAIGFIISLFTWIANLNNSKGRIYLNVLILHFILIAILSSMTPFSPSYRNLSEDVATINKTVDESKSVEEVPQEEIEMEDENNEKEPLDKKQDKPAIMDIKILNIILSSRDIYFETIYNDYVNSDILHKLFGLGYAGFYEDSPKLIEMDFFDIFFSLGVIGFILVFLPLLFVIGIIIKSLITKFKSFFHIENILLIISIGMGFGVAFLAGHVLYAPAVSIYLALSLVLLFYFNSNIISKEKI